jgi:signal transduction histidine kinase
MDHPKPSPDHTPNPSRPRADHRPARSSPDQPAASSEGADRLTILAHELGNILDGSLRSLGLAERALPETDQPASEAPDEARHRLDIVRQSLHRMAEIVEAAMRTSGSSVAGFMPSATPVELGEAIFHAVDVLTPAATEQGVKINTIVSNGLSGVPAGTLYPVIVNGLANAIEAVASAGRETTGEQAGTVDVSAGWTEDGRVRVTIRDDGVGLPNAATEAIFRFGFSTKARGSGVGLAVARAIVDELPGGTLRLFSRADRPSTSRPGAVFEVTFRPTASDAAGAA